MRKKRGETFKSDNPATSSLSTADLDLNPCEIQTISKLYRRLAVKHGLLTSMPPGDFALDSDDDSDSDDLFGWDPDPATALLPLVDAWLEVEEHLSEDEIPSPLEFDAEIREVIVYVPHHATRSRRADAQQDHQARTAEVRLLGKSGITSQAGHREDTPPPHSRSGCAGEDDEWRVVRRSRGRKPETGSRGAPAESKSRHHRQRS